MITCDMITCDVDPWLAGPQPDFCLLLTEVSTIMPVFEMPFHRDHLLHCLSEWSTFSCTAVALVLEKAALV